MKYAYCGIEFDIKSNLRNPLTLRFYEVQSKGELNSDYFYIGMSVSLLGKNECVEVKLIIEGYTLS